MLRQLKFSKHHYEKKSVCDCSVMNITTEERLRNFKAHSNL
jgi:hypothetical protein